MVFDRHSVISTAVDYAVHKKDCVYMCVCVYTSFKFCSLKALILVCESYSRHGGIGMGGGGGGGGRL